MSDKGITRRKFLGGAAVIAAASAVPLGSVATASAAPDETSYVWKPIDLDWTPLDPQVAAREGYDMYQGSRSGYGQGG